MPRIPAAKRKAEEAALQRLLGSETLLQTPKKAATPRQQEAVFETPPKVARRKIGKSAAEDKGYKPAVPKAPEAKAPVPDELAVTAPVVGKVSEAAKLTKIFTGLDLVLQLLAGRQRHSPFEDLQEPVLAQSGCDFTEERLCQVLHVAGGMLAAYWIGEGDRAYLTIEQRDKEGKHTRPEGGELLERKQQFEARLMSVTWPFPQQELPARPAAPPPRRLFERPEVAPRQGLDFSALPPLMPQGAGTAAERFEALRRRVKAKEALLSKQEEHEVRVRQLTKRIGICEDALLTVKILSALFDNRFANRATDAPSWRQKPGRVPLQELNYEKLIKRARVSELKLLSAVCSLTWGEQCSRPLSLEAGRAAIAQVKEVGDGVWFDVQKVEDCGNFLACIGPGGEKVRLALKAKIAELEEERRILRAVGPGI